MALYRFEDPALPGFELPLAQPSSPGDVRLNEGNPIVELDGSTVDTGCNGDVVSFVFVLTSWKIVSPTPNFKQLVPNKRGCNSRKVKSGLERLSAPPKQKNKKGKNRLEKK